MILKLQKQIKKLQKEINSAFESTQKELEQESELHKMHAKKSAQALLAMKQKAHQRTTPQPPAEQLPIEVEEWQVEYEE